jgi:hypothetical protein
MVMLSKSARNVPIGELNNIHKEFGLEVDVMNEEIVILETDNCSHSNVVRLNDGKFVCLQCQETRMVAFGLNIV